MDPERWSGDDEATEERDEYVKPRLHVLGSLTGHTGSGGGTSSDGLGPGGEPPVS